MIKKILSIIVIVLLPIVASAGDLRKFGSTSNIVRFVLKRADTGQRLSGLTYQSSNLNIYVVEDNSNGQYLYQQATGNIENIAQVGTYTAPTSGKCRFRETGILGLYEMQFADSLFSISGSKRLVVNVGGVTNLLDTYYEIQLVQFDPYDATKMGMTGLGTPQTGDSYAITSGIYGNQAIKEAIDSIPTSTAGIASAVWDTAVTGHQTAGSFGLAVTQNNQGNGNTAVNHNTGGTDNLRYVYQGQGIDNGEIKAFLKSDYDAGHITDAYVKAWSRTKVDGRWQWNMMLDSGFTYTIMFYKQGAFAPSTKEVTIP